jgi:hypothetical protein
MPFMAISLDENLEVRHTTRRLSEAADDVMGPGDDDDDSFDDMAILLPLREASAEVGGVDVFDLMWELSSSSPRADNFRLRPDSALCVERPSSMSIDSEPTP